MRKTLVAAILCAMAVVSAKGQTILNPLTANITAQSTDCSVANSCAWQLVTMAAGQSVVTLAGTFSGTFIVEQTNNGTTWTAAATLTGAGTTTYNQNGFTAIRVRCSAYTSGTAAVTISTGTGGSSGGGSSATGFFTSITDPTKFGLKADGGKGCLATYVNGNTTITTAATDMPFPSNIASGGYKVFGSNFPCAGSFGAASSVFPISNVTAFNNAHSITVQTAPLFNAGNGTTCCYIFWYATDNATAMQATLDAAAIGSTCGNAINYPVGFIMTSAFPVETTSNCGYTNGFNINEPGLTVKGQGLNSTIFVPLPTTSFANCVSHLLGCFHGLANASASATQGFTFSDFSVEGGGVGTYTSCTTASGAFIYLPNASNLENVLLLNFGTSCSATNPYGILAQGVGNGFGPFIRNYQNFNGWNSCMEILGTGQSLNAVCLTIGGTKIAPGSLPGFVSTRDSLFSDAPGASFVAQVSPPSPSTVWNSDSDIFVPGATNQPGITFSGSNAVTINLTKTEFSNAATGSTCINMNNANATVNVLADQINCPKPIGGGTAGSKVRDMGTNTIPVGSDFTNINYVKDGGPSVNGYCTGVVTASTTVALITTGLSTAGTGLATTCAGTTFDAGLPVQGNRTLQTLLCYSATTSVSLTCQVFINGSASTLTCTMTAATFCQDTTHLPTATRGQLISIRVTGGAAETASGIAASVVEN